jgi:hypothetical protein
MKNERTASGGQTDIKEGKSTRFGGRGIMRGIHETTMNKNHARAEETNIRQAKMTFRWHLAKKSGNVERSKLQAQGQMKCLNATISDTVVLQLDLQANEI